MRNFVMIVFSIVMAIFLMMVAKTIRKNLDGYHTEQYEH